MSHQYLTVPEASRLLGVTNETLRSLIHEGRLPALRVGKNFRIKPRDLDKLAMGPREEPAP